MDASVAGTAGTARSLRAARWLARAGGAAAGGCAIALLDGALLVARLGDARSGGTVARVLAFAAIAGLAGGLVASPIAAPLAALLARGRALGLLAGVAAVVGAIGALAADLFVLPRLYAPMHVLLSLAALLCAAVGGALLVPRRTGIAIGVVASIVAGGSAWLGPLALGEGRRARQLVSDRAALLARAVPLWPAAAAFDEVACEPPRPMTVPTSNAPSLAPGASILLVTIDALRGDLGGALLSSTLPRTSALLGRAFRFDRAYAPATRTTESVYGLLTGRRPHTLDFRAVTVDERDAFHAIPQGHPMLLDPRTWKQRHLVPMADRTPTLAELLGAAGHRTVTAIPYVLFLPASGIARGFDVVDEVAYRERNRDNMGITSDVLTARMLSLLAGPSDASAGRARPFFAWAHYMDPHAPYRPYRATTGASPVRERYLDEIARVDDAVAELLEGLASAGRLERAIVVITSDHGEEFREHGGLYHGTSVHEEQVRVPLLIQVPGLDGKAGEGRGLAEAVSLLDLAPTLVELVGARPAAEVVFDGRSLAPRLRGEPLASRPIYAASTLEALRVGVIDGHWKYVEDLVSGTRELYDLAADPGERSNVVDEDPAAAALGHCRANALGLAGGPFDPRGQHGPRDHAGSVPRPTP